MHFLKWQSFDGRKTQLVLNVLELNPQTKSCVPELLKHRTPPVARINLALPHLSLNCYQIYVYISECCLLQWSKMMKYIYHPTHIHFRNTSM